MKTLKEYKKELVDICRMLYDKNLVSAADGNISIKIDENRILTTPTKVNKGYLTEDMLVVVDNEGKVIEGIHKCSSEIKLHLKIYSEREDISSVIHTHPPYATAFALAHEPIKESYLVETLVILKNISSAPYGTPSTDEVPKSIENVVKNSEVILMENHGVVTYGKDLFDAFNKMEALENVAKTIIFSKFLGEAKEIAQEKVVYLKQVLKEKER
ncbi:L-fuculose-phosphate aldolase [Clostridium sp. USBA 49]|uniref:class II aldolase/adducin family protein n=1 Tax=Clostridium sp. USBA 49 TaxID=1881060 RepID=UPI00099AC4A6|nr:class II aldolase/adducin family protein [Clostridium sp. USBA 49]SKA85428.1 L-fuculose-phosphate aldolase [Clostridium sp. USBA 49]